jgi:hypothetical protein
MSNKRFREAIRSRLARLNESTERAIRQELAEPIDLGHSGRLQFEFDPVDYGIRLVQTEEVVLSGADDPIPNDIIEEAELAGSDLFDLLNEEVVSWFADRWEAAEGPKRYSPAYIFFHGLDTSRYDLEQRRWCSVDEVWPDE